MTTQGAQPGALCQPRGVEAVGGRREVQEEGDIYIHPWLIHVDVRHKPTRYCKPIILQSKINNLKKRILGHCEYLQTNTDFIKARKFTKPVVKSSILSKTYFLSRVETSLVLYHPTFNNKIYLLN